MASILPGFEYDIFISYRHNDNRSGWVTEFVNALQEELAATIKEPLTIYFDKNPHDGLLETHNVNKSLEGKLKCLIFIPIISQTYCDPKSFAWQCEFCVFNKLAKEDAPLSSGEGQGVRSLGRDIKLSYGNVASRILPIKIHDLDTDDKIIIEKEIGGAIRAIEFIFKSAGVNRPLTPGDNPDKNQNNTLYKDQINKVANAIKEIITAIKNPVSSSPGTRNQELTTSSTSKKKYVGVGLVFLLLAVASLFYLKLNSFQTTEAIDKSIAVLPFADMSPAHDQEYFGDGVSEEIINVLAQSEGLKVIARSSSFQFKGKNEDLKKVGEMLGVATILEGSIRKSSDQIRITAQLIKVIDGTHLWSKTFDRSPKDVFAVQDEIAKAVASALKASLSQYATSANEGAWNEEAKKEYQLGRYYFGRYAEGDYDVAFQHFKNSIAIDSTSAIVYPFLYMTCIAPRSPELCKKYLDKALNMNPNLPEALTYNSFWYMFSKYDYEKARAEINKALQYGPHNPIVLRSACRVMSMLGEHNQAIKMGEEGLSLDPLLTYSYLNLSEAYARAGKYDDAIKTIIRSRDISKRMDDELVAWYLLNDQTEDAIRENEKTAGKNKDFNDILIQYKLNHRAEANARLMAFARKGEGENKHIWQCAQASAFIGNRDLAFDWLEKSFKARSSYLVKINHDPLLHSLRSDSRFGLLLNKMALQKND